MSILIEGLTVVIRKAALNQRFDGGAKKFEVVMAEETHCSDADLFCIHLSSPEEVGGLIGWCEDQNLTFMREGKCVDIVVIDQRTGVAADCDWIECTQVSLDHLVADKKITIAWLFESSRMGVGSHMSELSQDIYTPDGWQFDGSLSESHIFIPR